MDMVGLPRDPGTSQRALFVAELRSSSVRICPKTFLARESHPEITETYFVKLAGNVGKRRKSRKKFLHLAESGRKSRYNELDAKAVLPEPRSVKKAISYQ